MNGIEYYPRIPIPTLASAHPLGDTSGQVRPWPGPARRPADVAQTKRSGGQLVGRTDGQPADRFFPVAGRGRRLPRQVSCFAHKPIIIIFRSIGVSPNSLP